MTGNLEVEASSQYQKVLVRGSLSTTLGLPSNPDVFVTDAAAISGLSAAQLSQALAIPLSDNFIVIEFETPSGLASPINRTNPGFVGGGRTAGGLPEFVVPNGPIPPGATVRVVK